MSLARALTTIGRRGKHSDADSTLPALSIGRAASQRAGRPIQRAQISSPMALVSTSNVQVRDATMIAGAAPIEIQHVAGDVSDASMSGDESDGSSIVFSGAETVTDASSLGDPSSPLTPGPEPNHLSCYFKPSVDTSVRSRASTLSSAASASPTASARPSLDVAASPRIPSRVPSHSKRAHERVHRTRSLQRIMSPVPASRRLQDVVREASLPAFVEAPEREAPFGQELAQLDEVAEEFGQTVQCFDAVADTSFMAAHGLACYSAADYMSEIDALVHDTFDDEVPVNAWI